MQTPRGEQIILEHSLKRLNSVIFQFLQVDKLKTKSMKDQKYNLGNPTLRPLFFKAKPRFI